MHTACMIRSVTLLRRGFYGFFPIMLVGTIGLSGFTPVSATTSSPDFFSKAFDSMRVSLAGNDAEKTKVKIGIAREYISSLDIQEYNSATAAIAQTKVNDAIEAVGDIEERVRKQELNVERPVLQSLLDDLDNLFTLYQEQLRAIQLLTTQDVLRASINTTIDRVTALSQLIKNDKEDLKDDGKLNGSTVTALLITLEGDVSRDGSILQLDDNERKFHLVGLPDSADEQTTTRMKVTGVIASTNEEQLVVTTIDPKPIQKNEQKQQEISGTLRRFGKGYVLLGEGGQAHLVTMRQTNDSIFEGQPVVLKGTVVEDVITIVGQESIKRIDPTKSNPFRAGGLPPIGGPVQDIFSTVYSSI